MKIVIRIVIGTVGLRPGSGTGRPGCVTMLGSHQGHSLRPNMDRFKFSEDIWALFLALYGGGPEVVLPADGGVRVVTPRPQTMAHLRQRLRVRSLAQRDDRGDVEHDP